MRRKFNETNEAFNQPTSTIIIMLTITIRGDNRFVAPVSEIRERVNNNDKRTQRTTQHI